MILRVNASKYISAAACKAKRDVRFYLMGVYLAPNGDAVGTDGHCLCKVSDAFTAPDGFTGAIIELRAKVPAKCEIIEFCTEAGVARFLDNIDRPIEIAQFGVLDGRYPDYNRVIPVKRCALDAVAVDVEILAKAAKVFHKLKLKHVRIEFSEISGSMIVTNPAITGVVMVVMPCRL